MGWFERSAAGHGGQVVADYMARLATEQVAVSPNLPGADVLWVKAQVLRRWDAQRQAQAPLDMMEPIQIAVGLAAASVLFTYSFPSLLRALGALLS